jgi:hypothetical protein
MSEQQAPPTRTDTPAVAGPTEAPGTQDQATQDIDWQKRYSDLQPEYTRATQELKELQERQQWWELYATSEDPDTQRQALEALGYELPDQPDEELDPAEYEDPYEELSARQQALEQQFQERTQAEQQSQEAALIRAITDERLEQLDGLTEADQDWVLAYAINALPPVREPGVPVPLPDVRAAYEVFQARETERQKQWASTKRAPYVPPGGRTANEVPDRSTHEGRVAYGMQRLYERQNAE